MLLYAQIYAMNAMDRMLAADVDLSDLVNKLKDMVSGLIGPVKKIGTIVCAAMCLFFVLKALAGDEQDVKQSIKRAKTCFVILIILLCFTPIINALLTALGAPGEVRF